jgi:hypothetical protein
MSQNPSRKYMHTRTSKHESTHDRDNLRDDMRPEDAISGGKVGQRWGVGNSGQRIVQILEERVTNP